MGVRVWGVVEDRLIEVRVLAGPAGDGLRVEGVPEARRRTTADRVRAALLNSGVVSEVPSVVVRVEPPVLEGRTDDLDTALAVGVLVAAGVGDPRLGWIYAQGRLGLDGAVLGRDAERVTLADVARELCHPPLLTSEHMFGRMGT